MTLSLEDAKNYMRVDTDEDDILITELIAAAEEFIFAATGFAFDQTNKRAVLLCRMLVSDWYDNRQFSEDARKSERGVSERYRRIVESMLMQLKYSGSV